MNNLEITVNIPSHKEETVWKYTDVRGGDIKYNKQGDATLFVFTHTTKELREESGDQVFEEGRVTSYIPMMWIRHIDYTHEAEVKED